MVVVVIAAFTASFICDSGGGKDGLLGGAWKGAIVRKPKLPHVKREPGGARRVRASGHNS